MRYCLVETVEVKLCVWECTRCSWQLPAKFQFFKFSAFERVSPLLFASMELHRGICRKWHRRKKLVRVVTRLCLHRSGQLFPGRLSTLDISGKACPEESGHSIRYWWVTMCLPNPHYFCSFVWVTLLDICIYFARSFPPISECHHPAFLPTEKRMDANAAVLHVQYSSFQPHSRISVSLSWLFVKFLLFALIQRDLRHFLVYHCSWLRQLGIRREICACWRGSGATATVQLNYGGFTRRRLWHQRKKGREGLVDWTWQNIDPRSSKPCPAAGTTSAFRRPASLVPCIWVPEWQLLNELRLLGVK